MRLLEHQVKQMEAMAAIVLLIASLAQAVALVMEYLAVPVVGVRGLAVAEQEHQAKVLLAVLVLTVVILVVLWVVAAAVLAQQQETQLTEPK
jgi:hypothetical protein